MPWTDSPFLSGEQPVLGAGAWVFGDTVNHRLPPSLSSFLDVPPEPVSFPTPSPVPLPRSVFLSPKLSLALSSSPQNQVTFSPAISYSHRPILHHPHEPQMWVL